MTFGALPRPSQGVRGSAGGLDGSAAEGRSTLRGRGARARWRPELVLERLHPHVRVVAVLLDRGEFVVAIGAEQGLDTTPRSPTGPPQRFIATKWTPDALMLATKASISCDEGDGFAPKGHHTSTWSKPAAAARAARSRRGDSVNKRLMLATQRMSVCTLIHFPYSRGQIANAVTAATQNVLLTLSLESWIL
jgi:hypothetical protein